MKANELRIGNYVNVPRPDQSPFRIDCIDFLTNNDGKFGMFQKGFETLHPLTWYFKDLQPIPLTEEWLLKFGFAEDGFNMGEYEVETFTLEDFTFSCASFGDKTFKYKDIEIKYPEYVHELQNLYFALTGYELEIKETVTP